jgi:phosphoglycolate phosphatase-like HAD superfamily hydrolase
MSRVIGNRDNPYKIFPGVREILAETDKSGRYLNALLTGNLSVAAEIKLRHIDVWKYFENAPNIFGEISHDRRELARDALSRVNEFLGAEVKPHQFIVIGDTPNDIACARAIGAKVVSVATGRNHPREALFEFHPDVLLDDLEDTKKVLEVFEKL